MSLRWTEEDLRRFEVRSTRVVDAGERVVVEARGVDVPRARRRGMNGTEALYALDLEAKRLAGEVIEWGFEDTRLKLAAGAWYKPDFRVVMADGRTEFHETKGFWREAARVRIKVAAGNFPRYRFVALTKRRKREGGGWRVEVF